METQPREARKEVEETRPRIRVSKVTLEGFKAFKEPFTLEIPPPVAEDDMDVFVIGSENGVGKTSLLEGICLAMLSPGPSAKSVLADRHALAMMVHAGHERADIWIEVEVDGDITTVHGGLSPELGLLGSGRPDAYDELFRQSRRELAAARATAIAVAAGRDDNPVIAPPVLYFHSYREIIPQALELATLTEQTPEGSRPDRSTFKSEVLRTLLAQADLLEGSDPPAEAEATLAKLDDLLHRFAGAHAKKLRMDGNALEIQVAVGRDGPPMSFDVLSSGQKEIISTLFLIWEATRDCPSVVLIDEPELHLNSGWHDDVIRMLFELAPDNQYIIATHSQKVAASVDADRLRILEP